jgi:putative endonuclease
MKPAREPDTRRRAWRYGVLAETACVIALTLQGYRVLARRYKTPLGEIDIIARRGAVLAFIEVKARASAERAAHAITPHQQDRIGRGARAYLQRHPGSAAPTIRFDAMLVEPWRWPVHLRDAWRPPRPDGF